MNTDLDLKHKFSVNNHFLKDLNKAFKKNRNTQIVRRASVVLYCLALDNANVTNSYNLDFHKWTHTRISYYDVHISPKIVVVFRYVSNYIRLIDVCPHKDLKKYK